MRARESLRLATRAGVLLPGLVAALWLTDVATRLVPLRLLAFRPWEAVVSPPGSRAPFLPGRRVERTAAGDLANAGGVPYPADPRREVFTTDAKGFRNSVNMEGSGPTGAVLFGDSFVAGAGLSDDETLAARLHEATGKRVFNAGAMAVTSLEALDEVLRASGIGAGGAVVFGLSEAASLPRAPEALPVALPGPEPTGDGAPSDLSVSRVGILSRRLLGRAAAWARLSPENGVVRRTLWNGDAMLFQDARRSRPPSADPAVAASWARLGESLGSRGLGLLVLLIPSKERVYGELVAGRWPPPRQPAGRLAASALADAGVPVLDLYDILREAARDGLAARRYVYWRDDTHWSPLGVRLAAAEVAARLDRTSVPGTRPGGGR